jgi:hypothetical protein
LAIGQLRGTYGNLIDDIWTQTGDLMVEITEETADGYI